MLTTWIWMTDFRADIAEFPAGLESKGNDYKNDGIAM